MQGQRIKCRLVLTMKYRFDNKSIGTEFENEMVDYLKNNRWWVHFIAPAANGSQPFDIIAVRGGKALAADCKTSSKRIFPITRLEDNQVMAFEKWLACGNEMPLIFLKYNNHVYSITYSALKREGSIDIENDAEFLY